MGGVVIKWAFILAMALAMALAVSGCESVDKPTVFGACGIFKPIDWSVRDTGPTQSQAKQHNAAGVASCGWRPE